VRRHAPPGGADDGYPLSFGTTFASGAYAGAVRHALRCSRRAVGGERGADAKGNTLRPPKPPWRATPVWGTAATETRENPAAAGRRATPSLSAAAVLRVSVGAQCGGTTLRRINRRATPKWFTSWFPTDPHGNRALHPMPALRLSRGVLALIAIGAVALALAAYVAQRGTAVDVARVESTRITQSVVVSGRVLAPAKADIGAAITGRVQAVPADEGDHVVAGAPLIELEQAELASALAQARASEAAAQTRIQQWREVGAPNAGQLLAQAEANYRVAERDAARQEQLFKQGFIGEARVDESRRAAAVAKSQLESAKSTATAFGAAGAERRLLEDQLVQARAARDAAAAKLAQTRIVAPSAGTILDRSVEPGDIVQPGKRLMTLAVDGPTRLTALIDEKNLSLVKVGQAAIAAADAFPDARFPARLEYLSPGIDVQRGTVEAKFSVASPPAFLRSDMTVAIDIGVADKENALVVPAGAVRDAGLPEPWVLVLSDGRAERRAVKLGARTQARAELLAGVGAGDTLIVTPGIEPGQRVRVR